MRVLTIFILIYRGKRLQTGGDRMEFVANQAAICMMFVRLFTAELISSGVYNLVLRVILSFIISQNLLRSVN